MVLDDETYLCDLCSTAVRILTEEDLQSFWSEWYSGLLLDLCPNCKKTEEGERRIQIHEQRMAAFASPR